MKQEQRVYFLIKSLCLIFVMNCLKSIKTKGTIKILLIGAALWQEDC